MRRGKRVPLPAPAEDRGRRDVCEVGHGPVRVPALVRRLAEAVRLDPVAYVAVDVLGPALLEVVAHRHVAVRRLAIEDPAGSDHAGVADVDDAARRLGVQPDPEAEQEHGRDGEHPDGPQRAQHASAAPKADPGRAAEEVEERRIGERHAREDVPAVEERERHGEGEQREEIEVPQRERPPQVGQAEQEDRAQREPDVPAVEGAAAERARAAAGHLPGDLWTGPRLGHAPGQVLDPDERHLTGLAGPGLHGPLLSHRVEVRGRARVGRVAVEPVRHLRIVESDAGCLVLGQPGDLGAGRRRRGRRERDGRDNRGREKTQPRGPNDQSLLPMKLTGVTRTIAIAWATISLAPASTRRWSTTRFAASASVETTRKRMP